MELHLAESSPRSFPIKPRLLLRFCLWMYVRLLIMSPFLYGAFLLLRLDPYLVPLLPVKTMEYTCILGPPLTAIFMFLYLWFCVKNITVSLDETHGIELKAGRRRRQIPWSAVTSYGCRLLESPTYALYLFDDEDSGWFATPILVIPPFVDCAKIAQLLEGRGIPKERRGRLIRYWKYHETWDGSK